MDAAANAVIDTVRFRTSKWAVESKPCDLVNLANPRTVHWKELVPAVQDFYSTKHIQAVPMTQWLAMKHMEECSQTMKELKAVSREWMDVWLKQWKF